MKPILIALIFLGAIACTSQLYVPTEKNVNKFLPATIEELTQGRELFVGKCGKCHDLPKLTSRSDSEWKKTMEKMGPKAKIDSDQSYLVLRYILNK
jgi:hypothetical protein